MSKLMWGEIMHGDRWGWDRYGGDGDTRDGDKVMGMEIESCPHAALYCKSIYKFPSCIEYE